MDAGGLHGGADLRPPRAQAGAGLQVQPGHHAEPRAGGAGHLLRLPAVLPQPEVELQQHREGARLHPRAAIRYTCSSRASYRQQALTDYIPYYRYQGAGVRVRDVGRGGRLAAGARLRPGQPGGLLLRHAAAPGAADALGPRPGLGLVRPGGHGLRAHLDAQRLQVGRLRGRRALRLAHGQALPAGLDSRAGGRRPGQVPPRRQPAQ